ncbi:ATP cone domain-containing protein [Aquimarina brevivitae]|uniref:Restriction endonuclease n=1 Tax=Aquimarina brevivitae TaxID=323412 RepID=A0A4Q7PIP9_9FLAO|nr:ATP cone domain-containing protein [Aquimarina brevivitae]RZS99700.1 restriction endonuclease [Aquimarina brevivitae]
MESQQEIKVIKSSGKRAKFSLTKLRSSLKRCGADDHMIDKIVNSVRDELYQGISTKEIYNRAYAMLKKEKHVYASKYKLKKAIYELGPTGFPFEKFVSTILNYSGYKVVLDQQVEGKCVTHEIDVVATKNEKQILVECKFHSEEGRNCDVKIPLYIHSRFQDILLQSTAEETKPQECWVVTNTRFTKDALQYGSCVGLYLLSWDYPINDGLKDRIDRLGLYPITVLSLLSNREKQFLLSRNVVPCRQLIGDQFYLDHLGVSQERQEKIMTEINLLANL